MCKFDDIADGVIKAGHDVSDGGLVTCLLEMAFAGNSGISVNINDKQRGKYIKLHFTFE